MTTVALCTIEGCKEPLAYSRGWCRVHYARLCRKGEAADLGAAKRRSLRPRKRDLPCQVEGCGSPTYAREFCNPHYLMSHRRGLSIEQIEAAQALDGCEICGRDLPLVVDHDHRHNGLHRSARDSCADCYRGMLCHNCNIGLGSFADDSARLAAAIAYLQRHMTS